jgi:hypothetical protein
MAGIRAKLAAPARPLGSCVPGRGRLSCKVRLEMMIMLMASRSTEPAHIEVQLWCMVVVAGPLFSLLHLAYLQAVLEATVAAAVTQQATAFGACSPHTAFALSLYLCHIYCMYHIRTLGHMVVLA